MSDDSVVNVTEAKAKLHRLIKRDCFAISRHGKVMGIYLSKGRIDALTETMELLSQSDFTKTLIDYESGRMKFHDAAGKRK